MVQLVKLIYNRGVVMFSKKAEFCRKIRNFMIIILCISVFVFFYSGIAMMDNSSSNTWRSTIGKSLIISVIAIIMIVVMSKLMGFFEGNLTGEELIDYNQREAEESQYRAERYAVVKQAEVLCERYKNEKSSIRLLNPKEIKVSELYYPTYIWKDDTSLLLFPNVSTQYIDTNYERQFTNIMGQTVNINSAITTINIPLDEIEYFTQDGELYREQVISGGGGGGSSLGGAILGGLIAGEAGAVVGSRKQTEAIKSETITHDTRHTILKLKSRSIEMDTNAFEVLNELIPEKEYSIVQELRKQNIIASQLQGQGLIQEQISPSQVQLQTTVSVSIATQIEELAGLRDRGILTEEEFNEKKKVLLDRM